MTSTDRLPDMDKRFFFQDTLRAHDELKSGYQTVLNLNAS